MLTVLVENETATPTKKHSMLPFLVVLFVVSYGLLALLVVEQDRTISAQSGLIHQLLGDSVQLSAIKGQLQRQAQSKAKTHIQAKDPSSQVAPQVEARKQKAERLQRQAPPLKPPTDASDAADERRDLITI
ncbi:MAG TPA: hypothetical protein VGF06_02975 [Terriglobales bacterium]